MVAWELIYPIGVIILGIGNCMWQYSRQDRSKTRKGDAVVRDRYDHPGRWDGGSR